MGFLDTTSHIFEKKKARKRDKKNPIREIYGIIYGVRGFQTSCWSDVGILPLIMACDTSIKNALNKSETTRQTLPPPLTGKTSCRV